MQKSDRDALIALPFLILIGLLFVLAGRDARFEEKWGAHRDYEACNKHTPVLIPRW